MNSDSKGRGKVRRVLPRLVLGILALFMVSMIVPVLPGLTALGVLLAGWWRFLQRVGPQIEWNWDLVGMAGLCLVLILGASHWFLNWLFGSIQKAKGGLNSGEPGRAWQFRWTMAINGLVWVSFFIGMAVVGAVHQVGWMMGTDEPFMVRRGGRAWLSYEARMIKMMEGAMEQLLLEQKDRLPGLLMDPRLGNELQAYWGRGSFEGSRLLLLIDRQTNYQGLVVFSVDPSDSIQGGQVAVVDRRKGEMAVRPRTELESILAEYRGELTPVYWDNPDGEGE